MFIFNKPRNITGQAIFVIIFMFFSTLQAKNLDKYNNANSIADYFSGILLLSQSNYQDSYKFLKKLDGLEQTHSTYSSKYLYSLVNSKNYNQAVNFSKKLEKEKQDSFESDLILGMYYLKNSKNNLSSRYFLKAKNRKSRTVLETYIANSLYIWSNLKNLDFNKASIQLNELDSRFENLKKIQNVFLNCYFDNINTPTLFDNLISNQKTFLGIIIFMKISRNIGNKERALKIIISALEKYPRNLLLNQLKIDLINSK